MVHVHKSTIIRAPIDRVWRILRDFNGHDRWHPAVADSVMEGGKADDIVGATRNFHLVGGEHLREQLLAMSDHEYCFSYCLVQTPIPLNDYVAHVRLRPVTDGDLTFWQWESRFAPPPGRERELAELVGEGVYEAGFAAMRALLESETTAGPTDEPAPRAPLGAKHNADRTVPRPSGTAAKRSSIDAQAIVLEQYGGPEVLHLQPKTVAPPEHHEVRIRQTAIGLNYIDVYCREGRFDLVPAGGTPGLEAVGEVLDVGDGVADFGRGDRVGYATLPPGAYCTIRNLPADRLIRLPDGITDDTAASLLVKGLTAEFLLHRVHALHAGESVLIHAAAGGVGSLLSQWAKAIGAYVIGTVGHDDKAEFARENGCDAVINYRQSSFVEATESLTRGRGVDLVIDGVGAATFAGSIDVLAVRGHLISYGQASGDIGAFNIDALAAKSITISRPNFGHYTETRQQLAAGAERLFSAVQRGTISPHIGRRFGLSEAADAHHWLQSRQGQGAHLLIP